VQLNLVHVLQFSGQADDDLSSFATMFREQLTENSINASLASAYRRRDHHHHPLFAASEKATSRRRTVDDVEKKKQFSY